MEEKKKNSETAEQKEEVVQENEGKLSENELEDVSGGGYRDVKPSPDIEFVGYVLAR